MEIQMWKEILTPYDLAVEELQVKFNHIIKEYRQAGVYSPIEQVLGRVKSISSIIEKAQRRGIEIDKIQENLFDIAGIRLICQFTEDIYTVVKLIKKRKDMTVISEKDYIKHIKESGYRSYHIIVNYEVETVKGLGNIFLGGEGLFLTRLVGPGKVILQSQNFGDFVGKIIPFLPSRS